MAVPGVEEIELARGTTMVRIAADIAVSLRRVQATMSIEWNALGVRFRLEGTGRLRLREIISRLGDPDVERRQQKNAEY